MDTNPENNSYPALSRRKRRVLYDAQARAERALNDPAVVAFSDALSECFRLERKAKPIIRQLEGVNFFVSPHGYGSSTALGVNLGRSLENMLRELQHAERSLRNVLSSLPTPPHLRPFQREARDAWLRFYEGDPEPLDRFIKKYLVRLGNHHGPVPDEVRKLALSFLDTYFLRVPLYEPGAWFFFGRPAQERLISLAKTHWRMTGRLEFALSGDGKSPRANLREKLPGAVFLAWEDIQCGKGSMTLLNAVDKHLMSEAVAGPKIIHAAEKDPHAFEFREGPRAADYELCEVVDHADNPLAQFVEKEMAREGAKRYVEAARALPRLVEKAALSPLEHFVYSFDQRVGTDFETLEEAGEAAAHTRNMNRSTVRVHRFKYRGKMNKAIASDPSLQAIFKEIAPSA